MGKNRKSAGGSNGGTGKPATDYTENNQKVFEEICSEKGVGKKSKEKLQELLEFANENNLEITKGKTFTSEESTFGYEYGGTARISMIDHETGKTINVFDDLIKGKWSFQIEKDSMNNVLSALRDVAKNTNKDFFNTTSDVFLTDNRLLKRKGKFQKHNALAFFDPAFPNAITIQSSKIGSKGDTSNPQPNSYKHYFGENSKKSMARTITHEMAHAYDYSGKLAKPSVFNNYGKYNKNSGPTRYSNDVAGETISTACEQVYDKRLRSDALMRDGTKVRDAFIERYDRAPEVDKYYKVVPSDASKMYNMWANDWPDLVSESERIMRG